MALTPVEIRHLSFPRHLLGYRRGAVDTVLREVVDSFEDVWRDRADLADKVEHLEGELVRFRELEAAATRGVLLAPSSQEGATPAVDSLLHRRSILNQYLPARKLLL